MITHCITKPAFNSEEYHENMGYKSCSEGGFYKAKFGAVMQDLKTRFKGHNIGHPSHSHVQVFTPEMLRVIVGKENPLRLIAAVLNATCRISGEPSFPLTNDKKKIRLDFKTKGRLRRSILDQSVWPYIFKRGGIYNKTPTLDKDSDGPNGEDWYESNTLAHAFVAHVDNPEAATKYENFAGQPEKWAKHVKAFVFAFVTDWNNQNDVRACAAKKDDLSQHYAIVAGMCRLPTKKVRFQNKI